MSLLPPKPPGEFSPQAVPKLNTGDNLPDRWPTGPPLNGPPPTKSILSPPDEDTMESAFSRWQQDQSQANLSQVVSQAKPHLSKAVQRHLRTTDPVAMGKAKALFIAALPRYDAQMSSLPTFIDRQLQPLIRWQATRQGTLRLPDRMRTESAALSNAEKQLKDENGRAPSTRQLADYTGLSSRRIANLRRATINTFTASADVGESLEGTPDQFGDLAVHNDPAASKAWINFVKHDLSDIDQFILERTLGLDGNDKLSNKSIAESLRISPGAVSQRKMRIQQLLDKESELNPFG